MCPGYMVVAHITSLWSIGARNFPPRNDFSQYQTLLESILIPVLTKDNPSTLSCTVVGEILAKKSTRLLFGKCRLPLLSNHPLEDNTEIIGDTYRHPASI